jgi:hypothetical protein
MFRYLIGFFSLAVFISTPLGDEKFHGDLSENGCIMARE